MPGSVNCSFVKLPDWQAPPLIPAVFDRDAIYIWYGVTPELMSLYDSCYNLLNGQERVAAARYHQQKDQQRYVLQHGILRKLLGRYHGVANAQLSFTHNQNKKPYLAGADKDYFFNLSHSSGHFLIAMGLKEMGVDIEKANPGFEYKAIASQWFSADEVACINQSTNQTHAFFLLWTRKEALLKACGTGIDDNLPLMPALDGKHPLPAGYNDTNWLTESFNIESEFIGSITYPSPVTKIKFERLNQASLIPF